MTGKAAPGSAPAAGRRAIAAWCLYDAANSAFPTVIETFVFAAYFTQAVAVDAETGTAQWGFALGAAGLAVAVLGPIFGAVADHAGRCKPWLFLFTLLAAGAAAMLWFTLPVPGDVVWALTFFALGTVGFELTMVFYNAMLPALVRPSHLGRVSGWGWGTGYAGGLACLVVALFVLVQAEVPPFGLEQAAQEPVRATTLLVAGWMLVFSLPLFLLVPDRPATGKPLGRAVRDGVGALLATLRDIRRHGQIGRYLLARMIYTDGLNTLFAFGGIYAAGTFGMGVAEIIAFGIALNISAGLGAFGFAWVDDRIGAKPTIVVALIAIIGLGLGLLAVESTLWFWLLGVAMGLFFGPAQAASRSLMARLAPAGMEAEMFGLYALTGKATAFVGPLVLGWVTTVFASQRAGMATIVVFLAAGLLLLLPVRAPRP